MSNRKAKYDHKLIEKKWQNAWLKKHTHFPYKMIPSASKFFNLWMFPYPSAEGLHAGHAFASTGSDVYGRFMRMKGMNVFQPIGYDSFGIHSENFAIKTGREPGELIKKTTNNYERQLKSLGHGYDWSRTVTTSDEDYYKWTQWLFVALFKAGLAYKRVSTVNFCPSCKTVLADEQVVTPKQAGKVPAGYKSLEEVPEGIIVCERCGSVVEKKNLQQWFFKITKYANRLIDGLSDISWPDKIKIAQTNWIGKKEGITIHYKVQSSAMVIKCWTSRPDTNFGSTFIVISPDNQIVKDLTRDENKQKVAKYIEKRLKDQNRLQDNHNKVKSGVFTGSYAINPLNGKLLPIWVSDFVLGNVGTGAVVGVPAHDARDFEFAVKFDLPITRVIIGPNNNKSIIDTKDQVYEGEGKVINSDFLDGINSVDARKKIMDYIEAKGWGERQTMYHLRDWIISRQRYWGPPIPMIYCESCASEGRSWFDTDDSKKFSTKILNSKTGPDYIVEVGNSGGWSPAGWYPEDNLPVRLPKIKDYLPKGEGKGPLADHPEFYEVECPSCGKDAKRETDVSDTFLDSAWYFLRYPSVNENSKQVQNSKPKNKMENLPWDSNITKKWLPVDLYFGGAEHAVLHLMYARFVTHVLYDLGFVDFKEPFPRFYAHGLMIKDGAKMSKSRGNVVNPDKYIEKFGADTMRLYLMFMGPMDGYPDFRDTGIEGMRRFVERIWSIYEQKDIYMLDQSQKANLYTKMHQTIKRVTDDIEKFHYNTAIAAIMEFVNHLRSFSKLSKVSTQNRKRLSAWSAKSFDKGMKNTNCKEWEEVIRVLAKLIAPFAPHLAEEVWVNLLGEKFSIHKSRLPKYNAEFLKEHSKTIVVQVDGKVRGTVKIDYKDAEARQKVALVSRKHVNVSKWIKGKSVIKTVFVPGRVINFITHSVDSIM